MHLCIRQLLNIVVKWPLKTRALSLFETCHKKKNQQKKANVKDGEGYRHNAHLLKNEWKPLQQ